MHIPVADLEADVDEEAVPLPTDVATVRLRPPHAEDMFNSASSSSSSWNSSSSSWESSSTSDSTSRSATFGDLQNNSLEGTVPESLGGLKSLHLLNLENNKLQGVLPQSLKRKALQVRITGNLCLSFFPSSCHQTAAKRPSTETPQVVSNVNKERGHDTSTKPIIIGATCLLALASIALVVFLCKNTRPQKTNDVRYKANQRDLQMRWNATNIFTYKEIKMATNNFRHVIGSGGFGSVYLGNLSDGKLVAVKVRFDKSQLGTDSFINEVQLLSQVHHQNLVELVGFCYESNQQILVYEYLPGGSLAENLYGSNGKKIHLNWARRLKIAVDAAKGVRLSHLLVSN
ncbi:hypothetical protein Taro_030059 [Colocasia esculenta]|uniref:Protein kinase domain-containing protein n=1 Tax=Colocasia esculenta TaxID=4460 RepID=A0A843VV18_COLES|nr:hypothetical protein [Colocasia esculenta]